MRPAKQSEDFWKGTGNLFRKSVPEGAKRRCENQGQERHQEIPEKLIKNDTET